MAQAAVARENMVVDDAVVQTVGYLVQAVSIQEGGSETGAPGAAGAAECVKCTDTIEKFSDPTVGYLVQAVSIQEGGSETGAPGAAGAAECVKCTDTIEKFSDPKVNTYRHLLVFQGPLDPEYAEKYLKSKSLYVTKEGHLTLMQCQFAHSMYLSTLCNNIDTMNTMLLRAGKPRIFVQSISQNGKIDRNVFGEPLDGADPDAMLELFCSRLAPGEMPLQIGRQVDLMNDKTFLRCMVKAMQTREKNAISKQIEQLSSTIQQGLRERQEIEAQNAELRLTIETLQTKDNELQRLLLDAHAMQEELAAKDKRIAELEALLTAANNDAAACGSAGTKRARLDDMQQQLQDFFSTQQQMLRDEAKDMNAHQTNVILNEITRLSATYGQLSATCEQAVGHATGRVTDAHATIERLQTTIEQLRTDNVKKEQFANNMLTKFNNNKGKLVHVNNRIKELDEYVRDNTFSSQQKVKKTLELLDSCMKNMKLVCWDDVPQMTPFNQQNIVQFLVPS